MSPENTNNLPEQFDPSRALLSPTPPEPLFRVSQTLPLAPLVAQLGIPAEADLQVAELPDGPLAFLTAELLLFDAAQSEGLESPWLVSFCPICNAGAVFSPLIDGQEYTFAAGGLYNAMALLRDVESGSYWNHIHGVCVHGPKRGAVLKRLGLLRPWRLNQALDAYPDLKIALAPLNQALHAEIAEADTFRRAARPAWSDKLTHTWVHRDERLPRYDMGLGVWTDTAARYYSILRLNHCENVVLDRLEGRCLLIYLDPDSGLPDAFYTEAQSFSWYNETLSLDNGLTVEGGVVRQNGQALSVERPSQLFIRWYGFAALFQNCDIYGA